MSEEQKMDLATFTRERLEAYHIETRKESAHEEDKNVFNHLHGYRESQKRLVNRTDQLRDKCYIYDSNCATLLFKGRRPEEEKW